MKIKLNKKTFLEHLEIVLKALDTNSPLAALKGICILASQSSLKLIASNGTLSIKKIIELNAEIVVIEPGKILVPGRLFKEIIKKQENEIEIKLVDKGNIVILSKGIKTNLNTNDLNDYPTINFSEFGKELIIDVDKLRGVIENVAFASAEGDRRIILNGVNLKISKGFLVVAATDSFRLAYEKIKIDSNIDFDISIISKNLKDFVPSIAKGEMKIFVDDSKIITQLEDTTILSKLIDGIYPDVEKLIPKEFAYKLTIETKELENLIEKVVVFSNENTKVVRMVVNKDNLSFESKRDEIGDVKVNFSNFQ